MPVAFTITIDPEFKNLLRPLSEEEYSTLQASILDEGCRDPIVLWKQDDGSAILVDGHNRYEICEELMLPWKHCFRKFKDRGEVIAWIIRTQLARRNLTDEQMSALRGRRFEATKKETAGRPSGKKLAHSEPISETGKKPEKNADSASGSTAERLAKEFGVSPATIKRDAEFTRALDQVADREPALRDAALAGNIDRKDVPQLMEAPDDALHELAQLPADKQRQAAKAIVGGEKTRVAAAKAKQVLDAVGSAVPEHLVEVFQRAGEFQKALTLCTSLTKALNALEKDDLIGRGLAEKAVGSAALRQVQEVRNALTFAKPYAVCPYCKKGKGCQACSESGWVSKRVYEAAPKDKKR